MSFVFHSICQVNTLHIYISCSSPQHFSQSSFSSSPTLRHQSTVSILHLFSYYSNILKIGGHYSKPFQMTLAQRFNDFTCDITHVSSLEVNRKYPIQHADRVTTRFGDTILQSIRDTTLERLYKVFLPQRYATVFKDDDLLAINDWFAVWNLVSKGRCPTTNSYLLAVE
jgi:hypothetical protein